MSGGNSKAEIDLQEALANLPPLPGHSRINGARRFPPYAYCIQPWCHTPFTRNGRKSIERKVREHYQNGKVSRGHTHPIYQL